MTVCIAAISGKRILCVADRQITHGDAAAGGQVEAEGASKLFLFRGAIMMYAGDVMLATDVAARTEEVLHSRGVERPTTQEIADAYTVGYNMIYSERINARVFGKWGITVHDFVQMRKKMHVAIVRNFLEEIDACEMEYLEVIIAGVTERGPDLWWGRGADVRNHRGHAYVAIGAGAPHVNSHLALGHYSRSMPRAEAIFLVYCAKRNAERAPGVGATSDLFEFGPRPDDFDYHFPLSMQIVGALYDDYVKAERAAYETAIAAIGDVMPTPGD